MPEDEQVAEEQQPEEEVVQQPEGEPAETSEEEDYQAWLAEQDLAELKARVEKVSELEAAAHQRNERAATVERENADLLKQIEQQQQMMQQFQQQQMQQPAWPGQPTLPNYQAPQQPGFPDDDEVDPTVRQIMMQQQQMQALMQQQQQALDAMTGNQVATNLRNEARQHQPPDRFPHVRMLEGEYDQIVNNIADRAASGYDQQITPFSFKTKVREALEAREKQLATGLAEMNQRLLQKKKQVAASHPPSTAGPQRGVRAKPKPKPRPDWSKPKEAEKIARQRAREIIARSDAEDGLI